MLPTLTPTLRRRLSPLAALGRSIYSMHRLHLVRFDLEHPVPDIHPRVPVVFREASTQEVERFAADPAHEVTPSAAILQRRLLESGCRCLIGLSEDRIVYHCWTTQRTWRIAGSTEVRLGSGKAMTFRAFTIADMRRQGIYAAALAAELRYLKAAGASVVFGNVDVLNLPSLRVIEKVGYHSVGTYGILRTAGIVSVWMKPSLRRMLTSDL